MHFLKTSQRLDYLETLGKIDTWLFISIHDSMYVCNNTPCNGHLTPEIQTLKMEFLDLIKEVPSRGPLPTTPRGNKFILTLTDYFIKWVEVFPVKDQTAVVCAQLILNEVICRFGSPLAIHSDQGRAYESQIFQELCKILEIRKTRTSPRNPKCNGQTEIFNRSILSMIKSYLRGEQTNWDMNLGCLAGAYRASPNESTCLTPNILMLGREVRLPYDLLHKGHPLDPNEADTSWGNHA
ncbi:unnamed protein product [Mytilus edulis]|uniref:Integrase catalytic domain-containing protein n=1 Tax=Mytilus edulis TaxID=6550 RepID=A0A8S3SJ57_MYTED|nr:unnamed protein product [Mytilus edulis]